MIVLHLIIFALGCVTILYGCWRLCRWIHKRASTWIEAWQEGSKKHDDVWSLELATLETGSEGGGEDAVLSPHQEEVHLPGQRGPGVIAL